MASFRPDRMTEKERLEALFNRQPVDRISFHTAAHAFAAAMAGYTKVEFYEDPEKSFWAKFYTREMFDSWEYLSNTSGAFGAREFGGKVQMPESEYSMAVSLLRPAVEKEEDVWNLKLPDVKTAGMVPAQMRFSKLQAEHGLPRTFVSGGILTRVGYISGVERMCRWMLKKPELVHQMCRLTTDFLKGIAEYWAETFGPECLIANTSAPTEANNIISPKQFKEFFLPYQKEVHEKLYALGIKHIYNHICGEQNLNLDLWERLPMGDPGIVSFGHEIDLKEASKRFPNQILMGNVKPAIIQMGTPKEIYEHSRICIEIGKKHPGGFILAPGCEVPAKAPPYNLWVMRKAIDNFGWY